MIQNLVVIRFSLRLGNWAARAYGDERNRESWFAFRAAIFNKVTLASLQCQTVMPKAIYLLMDGTDVDFYHRYIDDAGGLIVPIFSQQGDHGKQLSKALQQGDASNIALSRIDFDDMICNHYFEAINAAIGQAMAEGTAFEFVIATSGYRTDFVNLQDCFLANSPFLTLYTPKYRGQNIFAIKHETVLNEKHIACPAARWMQVVHGSNIVNDFFVMSRVADIETAWPEDFLRLNLAEIAALTNSRNPPKSVMLWRRLQRNLRIYAASGLEAVPGGASVLHLLRRRKT